MCEICYVFREKNSLDLGIMVYKILLQFML